MATITIDTKDLLDTLEAIAGQIAYEADAGDVRVVSQVGEALITEAMMTLHELMKPRETAHRPDTPLVISEDAHNALLSLIAKLRGNLASVEGAGDVDRSTE